MSVIGIILMVAFVIICILLICVVLLQNEEGEGLGGLFGGAGTQAFGAKSGNVLTKTTYVLVTLFFLASLGLALLNKTPSVRSIDDGSSAVENTWVEAGEDAAE
ncbi:MAG: preprotein translocase subunit SecG [Treponema sp.]|nr:preprotein translocase subunit SecG [Candidatus Treponema caballi]